MGRSRPNFSPKLEPIYRTSVYHDTHPPWGKYKWTSKEHMYMGVGNNLLFISNQGWKLSLPKNSPNYY